MVPDFWKPLTADYVAAGAFLFFLSETWPPSFWKPLTSGHVAAGVFFFFSEKWPPDV